MNRRTVIRLLFVAGALCVLFIFANFIVQKITEARLTKTIGLRTRMADFWISPINRTITIKRFTIANPEGFSNKPLFKLKSCSASVKFSTLAQDIIYIESIKLRGITITAEHTKSGLNLDYLKKGKTKSDIPTEKKEKNGSGDSVINQTRPKKRFIIENLEAKNIEVCISSISIGKNSINFKLPNIIIENFAETDQTPLTADEIIYRLVSSIIEHVVTQSPEIYQKLIRKFLFEQLNNFYKK